MSRVSYVMMNPGVGEGADARRARLPGEADGRACDVGRVDRTRQCSSSRSSATRSCTTCCSASTRRSSVAPRSRSPSTSAVRFPPRELGLPVHPGARVYVLPVHRRSRRRRHRGRDPLGGPAPARRGEPDRRRRHQRRDRAREPRAAAGRLQPHRACVRGRADQLRAARRPRGDRACAHRPGDARAAIPRDRLRAVVRRARPSQSGSPASAARGSSRRSRSCTWPE